MTGIKRSLSLAAVALAFACNDRENPTEPSAAPEVSASVVSTDSAAGSDSTAAGTSDSTSGPTIATDKPDYVPGEPVMMYGSGWQPGETVLLTLTEVPHIHGPRTFSVTADSLGNFEFDEFAPEAHHAGVGFVLTAVGQSSGFEAQTTFTDSIAQGGFSSNTNGAGGVNPFRLMLSAPAVAAGDLLIAQVTVAKDIPATEVICPPAGWTSILKTHHTNGATSKINQEIFYRVATGAQAVTTYTWELKTSSAGCGTTGSNPSARGAAGGIIRYTGVDVGHPSGPIEGFGGAGTGSGSSSTATAPSVPATAGARVVRFFGAFKNTSFTPATTPPRVYSIGSGNNSTERTAAAFDAALAAGSSTGTFAAGISSSAEWLAQTVALRLAVPATTTTLTAAPASPQQFGTSVTFTALVKKTSDNTAVATGTVRFYDGGTSCSDLTGATQIGGDQPLNASGQAQVSSSSLSVGAHTIRACYLGVSGTFQASEANLSYTIDAAQAATVLTVDPATGTFGGTTTLSATLTDGTNPVPNKTISFTLNGNPAGNATTNASGVASLAGVSLAGIDAGTYTNGVAASFASDATHAAANGSASLTVERADQTITFNALANKTFGDPPFTVSATASSGLAVSFELGSGSVGCSLSGNTVTITGATGPGQFCVIVAKQAGNNNYNPAPDVSQSFTIARAPTTTAVATSGSPTVFGESVTFTATVSSAVPGTLTPATVTFKDGPNNLGTAPLNCASSCTAQLATSALTTGNHSITAEYGGNANFDVSTSAAIAQVVNPAATSTAITSSPLTATYGDAGVAFQASVTANPPSGATVSEGTVNFTVKQGSTVKGTVSGAVNNGSANANFPLLGVDAGSYTVEADYQPAQSNPNFLASSDPTPEPLTVNQAPTTTLITSLSAAPYIVNGQVTVNFSVAPTNAGQYGSGPSGTVQVKAGAAVLCSAALPATSCSFTPTTVGNYNLTANYGGDNNFLSSASAASVITVKYNFDGFFAPVDRPNTLNVSKAGQAIPLKWRLTDANGAPVTNLTAINIKIGSLSCSTSTLTDLIEEYASGASGLQNHGNGNYQFNWKTPTTYANSCRSIGLDFGNGYVEWPLANFNFKK